MSVNRNYVIGILWFIASLVISNGNDIITKYMGSNIHPFQVAFFRFFFGTLSLLPFMLFYGKKAFRTTRPWMHVARGAILFVAITMWCYGLNHVPVTVATLTTFTIPFFLLILAPIFLKEKISISLWIATIFGFVGVALVYNPSGMHFNPGALVLLVSSFLFASLDVLNKKYVAQETMLSMLFYSSLVTSILSFATGFSYWTEVAIKDLALLFVLGAGGNMILFCLLKGFALINASAVAPYRYLELVLSAAFGYLIFSEIPTYYTLIGSAIIVPTTLFIAYKQAEAR